MRCDWRSLDPVEYSPWVGPAQAIPWPDTAGPPYSGSLFGSTLEQVAHHSMIRSPIPKSAPICPLAVFKERRYDPSRPPACALDSQPGAPPDNWRPKSPGPFRVSLPHKSTHHSVSAGSNSGCSLRAHCPCSSIRGDAMILSCPIATCCSQAAVSRTRCQA